MRKTSTLCATLLLSFLLFGCLPSLRPLYTEDTLIFDEQLLGKWYEEDGGIWSFTKEGEKEYGLRVVEEDGKEARFEVHLVQVGEHRFIDLYPGDNMDLENTADIYGFNLVPAHTFMKLELSEPNLLLQWVCLNEVIEDDPNLLKHEKFDNDSILITAKPEDIQRVVLENLDKVVEEDEGAKFRRCPAVFSEDDIVFDPKLLGQWESEEDGYLDIIGWENGYDILLSGESLQIFKGVLYNLNDRPVLGLYYIADASKESRPETNLPPDALVLIECDEYQLKAQYIEWDQVEAFLNGNSSHTLDDLCKPDDVFQRVGE